MVSLSWFLPLEPYLGDFMEGGQSEFLLDGLAVGHVSGFLQ